MSNFFDAINPFAEGGMFNGLSKPAQNYAALASSPQPNNSAAAQGIPAPQPPPWAAGPGDGSYGAPNDNLVGAYATAYQNMQPQGQPANVPLPPQRPAGVGMAPPPQAEPAYQPKMNWGTPGTTDPNNPQAGEGPGGKSQKDLREAMETYRQLNDSFKGFGSGPIVSTARPKQLPNKYAQALMNGPIEA